MKKQYPALLSALAAIVFVSSFALAQANIIIPTRSTIELKITPDSVTVPSSGSVHFTALVKNTPDVAVTWSASLGRISPDGLLEVPKVDHDRMGTVTVTSRADRTKSDTVSVLVKAEEPKAATDTASNTTPSSSSKTISQSFFGADFNGFGTWPPTDGQNQIATLGGIRLWDDNVKWADLETSNGKYDWSELDTWMSKAQAQGLDVLYTIGDTPEFAGKVPKGSPCGPAGKYSCSAPTDVNTDGTGSDAYFSDFITALVTRYKGQIAYYELWNEPDCTCFWAGNYDQIVRMGKDAAAIIHSIDSKATVLSPSAHGPTMKTWFDGYIEAGGAANFQVVNAHLRGSNSTNADPEEFLTMYDDVTAETAKRNLTSLPIWDDEHGIKQGEMTNTDELAGYAARSLLLRAGVGLQRQYVYTWDDNPPDGFQGNYSGTAWDTVAGWLIGNTISPCTASGTVYTCNLSNGQAVWNTAESCKSTCTTSSYTYPSTYKYQTDLSGTKTALSGKTVQIGYQPIFLTSK